MMNKIHDLKLKIELLRFIRDNSILSVSTEILILGLIHKYKDKLKLEEGAKFKNADS